MHVVKRKVNLYSECTYNVTSCGVRPLFTPPRLS